MSDKPATPGASHSVQCVHCKAVLRSAAPVPAGRKVKCPKCQQMFTTGEVAPPKPAPVPAAPPPSEEFGEDDEMARAIAKLEAEQKGGAKPAAPAAPTPAPFAPAPSPAAAEHSEDDEMAAAIAKLEAEQAMSKKPAAPQPAAVQPAPQVKAAPEEEDIPEVDDDLVAPDEEEPAVKKKKRRDEDEDEDERPAKKKRRRDEDEEDEDDDRPRSKKKRRDEEDDEEDDRPRSKKERRDEEDDDEPRGRKQADPDEDDGAFTEKSPAGVTRGDEKEAEKGSKPASKKRRDDDDGAFAEGRSKSAKARADLDDEPRSRKDRADDVSPRRDKKKRKKGAGSPLLLIGLAGGGILGLLLCCACGVGGFFVFGSNPIVGRWEMDFFMVKIEFAFNRTNTGTVNVKAGADEGTVYFNYTLTRGDPMILEMRATRVEAKGQFRKDGAFLKEERPGRFRVTVEGDSMTLDEENAGPGLRIPMRLRRVR